MSFPNAAQKYPNGSVNCWCGESIWRPYRVSLTLTLSRRKREFYAVAVAIPGLKPRAGLNASLACNR